MADIYFSVPQLLWILPLLLLGGLAYAYRSKDRILVLSRLVVFSLVIVAAANPYVVASHTTESSNPSITLLDDKTSSMSIFDDSVASRLNLALPNSQVRSFSGDATALGDEIVQNAVAGSTLVLVSDGYSNKGRPLKDALSLASNSNATVFAIQMFPTQEDASVEISGTNTAVLGGDYPFKVVVRSSGEYQGPLTVYADGNRAIYSEDIVANGTASVKISHTFTTQGTHSIKAVISDGHPINNEYQKAVYVVPKPDILLISKDAKSPLATVLSGLYKLTQSPDIPSDLSRYKAVVLDDMMHSSSLDAIKDYVRNGGGLVVIGGPDSYELGGYYGTALEEAMPTRSQPSIFVGGKTVVLVLDISFSLQSTRTKDGTPLLDYEKALALELLKSPDFQDYKVGAVIFGSKAYAVQDPIPITRGRGILDERIAGLSPTGTQNTYLDTGIQLAWEMLNTSQGKGDLIILSDGKLYNYPEVYSHSIQLLKQMNATTRLIQVQAFRGAGGELSSLASDTGSDFANFVYPESITTKLQQAPEVELEEIATITSYPMAVVNTNHYITSDLGINATITGFNDVTPKPGSQKLVAMADGKPALTVWRYGLGRAASLSTDDGTQWASELYSAANSALISSMINWAVGDPRPENNRIEAEDGWTGTPLVMTVLSSARPAFDQGTVEKIGENRYTVTFTPNAKGIYYMGNYGIAVNYPQEYLNLGFNPDLSNLIMANGGGIFTETDARKNLVEEARRMSVRTVQDRVSRRSALLLAALALFLGEVIMRRLQEIRRWGPKR